MRLVKGAWKILVGIKDGLVLIAMLIFFGLLFTALSNRPNAGAVKDGALLLAMDGALVEQPSEPSATAVLTGASGPSELRLRDVVRALDAARTDAGIKAVVVDLDRFAGGYPASVTEVANAVGRVRAVGKPVLAYATAYDDRSYLIAANASEIWMDPMGGTLFAGPGGSQLYYKGLLDRLGVTAHIYHVGKFKSAIEPFARTDASPEAKEALSAVYGSLFGQWRENIAKARPKARIADLLTQPDKVVIAANGDIAKANLAAGMVDKLGDRVAFGQRVAQLVGAESGKPAGTFNATKFADWVAANPLPTTGDAIGIITVAGDIVGGDVPGMASGDEINRRLLDGLATKNLKALVVRIDSPGGSALASEQIRQTILRAKERGLPVVVSMGGIAASGGYWIATAGDTIFAEPNTVTGSIGIFAVLPTFENTLAKIGVTADGVRSTPLSGQPDLYAGTNPTIDALLQASIENGYRQFLNRVATARKMTPERVDAIGQGRIWDGGTARQLGLVDRFGTLDDAVAEAAKRAKLDPKNVHALYLEKEPGWAQKFAEQWSRDDEDATGGDAFARIAGERRALVLRAVADLRRLAADPSVQARCLECGALAGTTARADTRLLDLILARVSR